MLYFLPAWLRGLLSVIGLTLSAILIPAGIALFGLLRLLVPIKAWQTGCYKIMNLLPTLWTDSNNFVLRLFNRISWHVEGAQGLDSKAWYFLVSNHSSWNDIFVLYAAFNRKAPPLKFFLKQQLIWVPFIGLACKALHFPFMYRHSKTYLKKHPEKKGKDIEATKKSCQLFKHHPSTIILFPEATRFTPEKQQAQDAPYQHLLRPKGSMLSLSLSLLGREYIKQLIDVTISYDRPQPSFWDLCCGRVKHITVKVKCLDLPDNLVHLPAGKSEMRQQAQLRKNAQGWLDTLWQEKDAILAKLTKSQPVD